MEINSQREEHDIIAGQSLRVAGIGEAYPDASRNAGDVAVRGVCHVGDDGMDTVLTHNGAHLREHPRQTLLATRKQRKGQ